MSGIRGRRARDIREQQHEAAQDDGPPLFGPLSGFDAFLLSRYGGHQESIAPVAGGKTPAGRLQWRKDGPSLFVVKP